MELKFDSINYKDYLNNISLNFSNNKIMGIYGDNSNYILDIINGDIIDYEGNIVVDNIILDKNFYKKNSSFIALIDSKYFFYTNNVEEEFKFNLAFRKKDIPNIDKKICELLTLVGFESNILKRDISSLSSSEKYLLSVAINLIYEPKIILFKDVFFGLDRNNKKKMMMVIKNLKEENKILIVTNKDTNILYELVDEVILLDNSSVYKIGACDKIFTSNDLMKEKVIPMPYITRITYLAKSKKVKLTYHKDVRDIIKDIYKHV